MKQKNKPNHWRTATIVLAITALLLLSLNFYTEKIQEKQKLENGKAFLDFAAANKLGEVCSIEDNVCCNTRTGKCYKFG